MNDINFLPSQVIHERGRRVRVWRQTILIAAAALLMVAWYVSWRNRLASLEDLAASRRQEAAALADQAEATDHLARGRDNLQRQARLQHRLSPAIDTSSILTAITQVMPSSLALSELSVATPAPASDADASSRPAIRVQLAGVAPDESRLGDFVARLADHPLFSNAKLLSSRAVEFQTRPALEFHVELAVRLDREYRIKASLAEGGQDAPAERDQVRAFLIIAALTVLFILGLWLPAMVRESQLHDELAQTSLRLSNDRPKSTGLARMAQEVVELQANINQSRKYIPRQEETADILRQLTLDLTNRQVADLQTQTHAPLRGRDFTTLPVTLRFRGSFPVVFAFLRQIESMRRLVRVARLNMAGDPSRPSQPPTVTIDLCLVFSETEALSP